MGFADRTVRACVESMSRGRADEWLTQDVLRCEKADVKPIEQFLDVRYPSCVRLMAVRIIGKKGDLNVLLNVALNEHSDCLLSEMMKWLGKRKAEGIEVLGRLLESGNEAIKESAIQMFRRAGKTDVLFPMLFDKNDITVQRIKRYFDEQER